MRETGEQAPVDMGAQAGMAGSTGAARPPFRVFFDRRYGETWVYGPGVIAFLLIVSGYLSGDALVMLTSLFPMSISFYHQPLIRGMPQLEVNADGLFLDGLGLICWEDMATVELEEFGAGRRTISELIIETREPLELVLQEQKGLTLARSLQIMVWRLEDADAVAVRLMRLHTDPADLMAEIRHRRYGR